MVGRTNTCGGGPKEIKRANGTIIVSKYVFGYGETNEENISIALGWKPDAIVFISGDIDSTNKIKLTEGIDFNKMKLNPDGSCDIFISWTYGVRMYFRANVIQAETGFNLVCERYETGCSVDYVALKYS